MMAPACDSSQGQSHRRKVTSASETPISENRLVLLGQQTKYDTVVDNVEMWSPHNGTEKCIVYMMHVYPSSLHASQSVERGERKRNECLSNTIQNHKEWKEIWFGFTFEEASRRPRAGIPYACPRMAENQSGTGWSYGNGGKCLNVRGRV
jgi:hypothetical protein